MIKSELGKHIRDLRNAKGYSQERLAQLSGMNRTYIAGIELGRRNVSIENLNKIAKAMQLPLSELCDVGTPVHRTILLHINGELFILESNTELSPDLKENIEAVCRYAYDMESEFGVKLSQVGNEDTLYDKDVFDIAMLFTSVVKEKFGLEVVFKAIDLEVTIQAD